MEADLAETKQGKDARAAMEADLAKAEQGKDAAARLTYENFSILESKFLFGCDVPELFPSGAGPTCASPAAAKVCVLSIDGGRRSARAALGRAAAARGQPGHTARRLSPSTAVHTRSSGSSPAQRSCGSRPRCGGARAARPRGSPTTSTWRQAPALAASSSPCCSRSRRRTPSGCWTSTPRRAPPWRCCRWTGAHGATHDSVVSPNTTALVLTAYSKIESHIKRLDEDLGQFAEDLKHEGKVPPDEPPVLPPVPVVSRDDKRRLGFSTPQASKKFREREWDRERGMDFDLMPPSR